MDLWNALRELGSTLHHFVAERTCGMTISDLGKDGALRNLILVSGVPTAWYSGPLQCSIMTLVMSGQEHGEGMFSRMSIVDWKP